MKQINGYLRYFNRKPCLWLAPFTKNSDRLYIDYKFIKQYYMKEGVSLTVESNNKQVSKILSICGINPEEYRHNKSFYDLVAINPTEPFNFDIAEDSSIRFIDMIAPLAKGSRSLIISPPKAGKTMLLKSLAQSIRTIHPDCKVIVFLVDERPEEVTDFRRSVDAEVFATSSDENVKSHLDLAKFLLSMIRFEAESGKDIVVLVDSLTRLGRNFNQQTDGRSKIMSGGLASGALEMPRKFFGMARNIENGGSVTIIATALVNTGSRMDKVIFEEFKGTGNNEIMLDVKLAQDRIFPAINIRESGTRRDDLLFDPLILEKRNFLLRKLLNSADNPNAKLIEIIGKTESNLDLLSRVSR